MKSLDLMDCFYETLGPGFHFRRPEKPEPAPELDPAPDLALRASFGIPDIERLLRENKELRAERDALKTTMVEIKEMIEQWQAVRKALHG